MDSTQAQAEPTPPPSADPTPTQATPDPASITTQPTNPAPIDAPQAQDDLSGMDRGAYEALKEQYLNQEPQAAQEQSAQQAEPEGAAPEQASPANETFETEPTEDGRAPERIRLGGLPDADRALTAAAVLAAKAQGISVAEAMRRLTGEPAAQAPAPDNHEPEPAATPSEPEAILQRIAQLEQDEITAGNEADTVRLAQLRQEIRRAERELVQAEKAQADTVTRREAEFQNFRSQARELYPDLKDKSSALSQEWIRVYEDLEAAGDPLLASEDPRIPLVVSQMAARRLAIAPAATGKAAPKASPSIPSSNVPPTPVRSVQLAPGSARSAAPANPTGQLESRLAATNTLSDYEALKEELAGR